MKKLAISILTLAFLFVGFNSASAAGDKNCPDFASKEEVMDFWYSNGYSADNDPHDLDRDNDGYPCEVNKGDYDNYVASKEAEKETDSNEDTNKNDTSSEQPANTETSNSNKSDDSNSDNDKESSTAPENSNNTSSNNNSNSSNNNAKEGEKLPDTATNSVAMMGVSAAMLLVGFFLVFRKKQTN